MAPLLNHACGSPACPPTIVDLINAGSFASSALATMVKVSVTSGPATINGSSVGVGCYSFGNDTHALGYPVVVVSSAGAEVAIVANDCGSTNTDPIVPPFATADSFSCEAD